jgi:hypothetical protein
MPPSDSINSNGKRIWESNANGGAAGKGKASDIAASASGSNAPVIGRDPGSGYQWRKDEDAPGYVWGNSKAREDAAREFARFVDKDRMIKGEFGFGLTIMVEVESELM